ncbi:MAG: serine/threonine protein kinase [Planctomycetota bacterium]|nr:MAG: serine/threonine protein kinase [Planctomycetota bacterium]
MAQIKNVLFGKLAVSTRFITEQQLQECLDYQKEIEERGERPPRLGEILEQKGYLTKQQIQSILETMSSMQRRRFGEIAVAFHFITLEQLETCLDIQKLLQAPQETVPLFGQALVTYRGFLKQVLAGGNHPKIGDVLVAMGYMRNHQVEAVLEEQNKRIVRCKSCEASLNISRFEPGQKIKCGQCNAVLEVVKPEGSEELDVALPTETMSQAAGPSDDQPMDPATAMMELDKEIARVRATQQFTPAKIQKAPGRIADFQVVTRLGQDATGVIFKATQISKNRPVALKIMNPSVMNDANFQKKFIDEAKKVAALEHPHIKRVYSLGKSDNRFYIAMEFVEAESVYNVLEKQGKFHFETAVGIAMSIAEALQYAQSQGLIHGDVRPSNVLLLRDGSVKVANLGLATKVSENILAISRSGQMAPFYIAPECVTGDREMDQRTDIYSLGATLFHMIAGRPPFQGQSPFEVLVRLTEETIPPLKFFDPSIPDSVCRVVEKMLEAEPQDRYQTWEEIISELRAIQAATGSAAAPASASGIARMEGAASKAGAPPAVKTADDAKKAYAARAARSAGLRSLRRAGVIILVVGGLGGGLLFGKNYYANRDREEIWATLQGRYKISPKTQQDFEQRRENFTRFANTYPGTPEAMDAESLVVNLRKLEIIEKDNELQTIKKQVATDIANHQFKAARDALSRYSFWKKDDPELQALIPGIDAAAAMDWQSVVTKAIETAKTGEVQRAHAMVDEAKNRRELLTDTEDAVRLHAQIEQIRRDLLAEKDAEAARERLKKSKELMDREIKDVQELMKKYYYQQAVAKLSSLRSTVHPDHIAEVDDWRERVEWSTKLQVDACRGIMDAVDKWNTTHDSANDKRPVMKMTNGLEGRAIGASPSAITFQDLKATATDTVAWSDLNTETLIGILATGLLVGGSTNQSHFAVGDCASFKAEVITDVPTRVRLMTVAEREYKAASDSGLSRQSAPRMEATAKFFVAVKKEFLDNSRSAIQARKFAEARANLRSLVNLLPTRLDDIIKEIHATFAASFAAEGSGGQYVDFLGGAPAALKPSTGWSAARGVLSGIGKDETLEVGGAVTEVGLLFRLPDDKLMVSIELEGAKITYKPGANNGEGSIEIDLQQLDETGKIVLKDRKKCLKLPSIALNKWHSLEVRESSAGGVSSLEIVIDGVAVTPKGGALPGLPLKGLILRLRGEGSNKEGRVDFMGLFTRTK